MQRQRPELKPWEWAVTRSGGGWFAAGIRVPVMPVMQHPSRGTLWSRNYLSITIFCGVSMSSRD